MASQTPAKQLFDLLVTKNFDPELLTSAGKAGTNPEDAEVFSFDWTSQTGNDYGTVVAMLAEGNDLQIYFGDNLGRGMDQEDKTEWFNFLQQLKHFATKNLMSFSPKNLNRLKYAMQSQASLKEGIFESWTGTRTTSWNGRPTEARLMIKHKRPLDENDARFRYVESLFIETVEGERYKLPFTKLSGGRAMVEHIRQGGRVWDPRGQHITEMVDEINVISRFRRANHGKIFEGDTQQLVEQTNAYYEGLQKTLKSMSKDRGYTAYFESWNPGVITEEEAVVDGLKHLFVTQNIDSRIEDALPLLARIQQQGNAMKEANIFEAWVDNLAEGTWATPDTPEKQKKLVELLSAEFPVGSDATNATEQLYDLIGDDELFDQLEALAEKDADADCRQVVMDRMQMLSGDPDVKSVIDAVQISDQATMNPAEPTDAGASAPPEEAQTNETAEESNYPEYEADLESILRIAGVPAEPRPAPDYADEVAEESLKNVKQFGGDAADRFIDSVEVNQRDTDVAEGENEKLDEFLPALAAVGRAIATGAEAVASGVGELVSGGVGGTGVPVTAARIGANMNSPDDTEATDEGALGAALGGAAGGYITKSPGGVMTGAKMGSKVQDMFDKDKDDTEELPEEKMCNMTDEGENCPIHGMKECWGSTTVEESKPDPFMSRIKSLAGIFVK